MRATTLLLAMALSHPFFLEHRGLSASSPVPPGETNAQPADEEAARIKPSP